MVEVRAGVTIYHRLRPPSHHSHYHHHPQCRHHHRIVMAISWAPSRAITTDMSLMNWMVDLPGQARAHTHKETDAAVGAAGIGFLDRLG